MTEKYQPIPHRLKNMAVGGHVAGAVDILDDNKGKNQEQINAGVDAALANRYTKAETYRKYKGQNLDEETYSAGQLNNMITTPPQEYVSIAADNTWLPANIDTLISTAAGEDAEKPNTVYRVGYWDGTEYDETVYSEYAWDGTGYIHLDTKQYTLATVNDFVSPDATKRAKIPTVGATVDAYGYFEENPEWLETKVDSDGKIIEGILSDGTREEKVGLNTPSFNGFKTTLLDNREYMTALLDEDDKVISFRDKDGVLHENAGITSPTIDKINETIESQNSTIDNIETEIGIALGNKIMKVNLLNMEGNFHDIAFTIRTKYNSEKDILIRYFINGNKLISPYSASVGPNTATDSELINTYTVSSHGDSSAPLFRPDDYWALFAQHGYVIPYISNTVSMTSSDVGAEWKDQLNRHYTIGKVDSSNIYLLPVIYKDANNHDRRDWSGPNTSEAITSLQHVSGGTYTSDITVSGYDAVQLYPMMEHYGRKFYADGMEITSPGEYSCNSFSVSESQIGYDPATIQNWWPINLADASEMTRFTWSYNFYGAQCCVNTTIDMRKETKLQKYGGTQQMFFVDQGDYKAMFLVPKAGNIGGIDRDKPFNSPSLSSLSFNVMRTVSDLRDVDDPIDRQIGYLYDSGNDDYRIGMSTGLSLVSGDTVKEKRLQNCPIGSELLGFSPANYNKFYVAAINNSGFSGGYIPDTYFKEINYYVCYFDPAENTGQVYWYKDGGRFVIYCHCQSSQDRLAISVPSFMEGLSLSVVEKTDDTTLLTDTIQNGRFFVSYSTNSANHIVLTAK